MNSKTPSRPQPPVVSFESRHDRLFARLHGHLRCWVRVVRGGVFGGFMLASCSPSEQAGLSVVIGREEGPRTLVFDSVPHVVGPLRLSNRPWLQLGGLQDNDTLEFDARGVQLAVAETHSGELVVGDHQRLKYFDRQGRLIRTAGRAGMGPGEFGSIRDLCPQSDSTLIVIDDDGRWSHWSRSGQHLTTQARVGFIPPRACTADGRLLAQVASAGDPLPSQGLRRRLASFLFTTTGLRLKPLEPQLAPEYHGQIFFEPGYAMTAASLIVADPRTFELRETDLESEELKRRWLVQGGLRPLGDHEWDSLQQSMFPPGGPARRQASRATKPEVVPGFSVFRLDLQQRLWMSLYFMPRQWLVIDQDGARLSRVELPYDPLSRPALVGFVGDGPVIKHADNYGAIRLSFHRLEERSTVLPNAKKLD